MHLLMGIDYCPIDGMQEHFPVPTPLKLSAAMCGGIGVNTDEAQGFGGKDHPPVIMGAAGPFEQGNPPWFEGKFERQTRTAQFGAGVTEPQANVSHIFSDGSFSGDISKTLAGGGLCGHSSCALQVRSSAVFA